MRRIKDTALIFECLVRALKGEIVMFCTYQGNIILLSEKAFDKLKGKKI